VRQQYRAGLTAHILPRPAHETHQFLFPEQGFLYAPYIYYRAAHGDYKRVELPLNTEEAQCGVKILEELVR